MDTGWTWRVGLFLAVPTFIVFLQDVESPYEVHDYVRSYLGESKDASEFATQFLERRSKYKNHLKQPEQPEVSAVYFFFLLFALVVKNIY